MKIIFERKILTVILVILLPCLLFFGCKNKEKKSNQGENELSSKESYSSSVSSDNSGSSSRSSYNPERPPVLHKIDPVNESDLIFTINSSAHAKYLKEPLVFQNVPDGGFPSGDTAVVGSDVCRFYPVIGISSDNDLSKIPEGELIPFAAIIQIGDKINQEMFTFQDNYNFFYKATWNGKEGMVFGADLFGIDHSNESNRINALLYKGNGHFDNFYSYNGYYKIRDDITAELRASGLAIQEVKHSEYKLSGERPDDMISLYMDLYQDKTSVFITTDLAAHANHLVFDRILQYLEEEYFFPQLVILTDEYVNAIEKRRDSAPEDIINTSLLYFQTAKALLALAPEKHINDDYFKTVEYIDVEEGQVLFEFADQVSEEVRKMNGASGIGASSVFSEMKEDYSQYKVRGHYTKNGVLGAYFRALMWFGRINFDLEDPLLSSIALFITDVTENSKEIKSLWQSLFDPITEIIGVSDDISFHELAPLWDKIKGAGFNQWYNDPGKIRKFTTIDYKALRTPAISGFSLIDGPYSGGADMEDRLPPVGWRLFGQRYTMDSEIHHNVSPPRYYNQRAPRNMVRGLDIMKVFGSVTADRLLKEKDFSAHSGLEDIMNSMQAGIAKIDKKTWFSTYYSNVLYQIKTLSQFENGAGFYFTEQPGWGLKAMNSAHGAWAELRHDTILYVKQSYAEMGGGWDGPTFRTKPLPDPVDYIEPNVPFWNASVISFQKMYSILEKYNYLDGSTARALTNLHKLYIKASEISVLEAGDMEVSKADLKWIRSFPMELAKIVVSNFSGADSFVDDPDSLRMALVADVYTNAEAGMVLETAVGIPYRLYIPLNDKQGGKRIALGYGFSYYEFNQRMSNRLNNDEWKAIVYGKNADLNKYLPFWMEGKVKKAK